MGKLVTVSLLLTASLGAFVQAQGNPGTTVIKDFTVLVNKATSQWDHFNFDVIDEDGESFFCSPPLELDLNTEVDPNSSTVSDVLPGRFTRT